MRGFITQLCVLATVATSAFVQASSLRARALAPFGQRAIYTPASNYRTPKVLYPRSVKLTDGSLLATWENYSPEPPKVYFPIYKSTDNGASWKSLSTAQDTVNGWGLRYQPLLYVLPNTWAGYAAGTVLLVGNSIPSDLSATRIELYASTNGGVNWNFVSHIAVGGPADTTNGKTPIWEPFALLYSGALYVYYSDQRDPSYGQKIVHQSSSDGKTWGGVVNDVTSSTYTDRPGMPTIAALPNGKYIMTYENGSGNPYSFPVYYKIASNPTAFGSVAGTALRSTDGTVPVSSPYVAWSAYGGSSGTIIVSAGNNAPVFLNSQLGAANSWTTRSVTIASGYSREVKPLDTVGSVMILGAGPLGGNNYVSNAIINL